MHMLMQGKTCTVTGSNSGIGKETALGLARMGARVVMVCQDRVLAVRRLNAKSDAVVAMNRSICSWLTSLRSRKFDRWLRRFSLAILRSTF